MTKATMATLTQAMRAVTRASTTRAMVGEFITRRAVNRVFLGDECGPVGLSVVSRLPVLDNVSDFSGGIAIIPVIVARRCWRWKCGRGEPLLPGVEGVLGNRDFERVGCKETRESVAEPSRDSSRDTYIIVAAIWYVE